MRVLLRVKPQFNEEVLMMKNYYESPTLTLLEREWTDVIRTSSILWEEEGYGDSRTWRA